jgi:sensor histidine kinase YesM
MIQPLVENAIWHGLMHKDGEKKIVISFCQNHDKVICTIEDNGIGINASEKLKSVNKQPHRSLGLDNLRNRIKIINEKYDMNCTLDIIDLSENNNHQNGTVAVLKFKIMNQ